MCRMRFLLASVLVSLSITLFLPAVRADALPPEGLACWGQGQKPGDACALGGSAGACKAGQCTKVWRDGGTSSYDCLVCVPGVSPDPCSAKQAGDACTVGGSAGTCKAAQCTWVFSNDGGTSNYDCLECVPGGASDGTCTIAKQGVVRRVGPWVIAGLFSLLALVPRLRRRR